MLTVLVCAFALFSGLFARPQLRDSFAKRSVPYEYERWDAPLRPQYRDAFANPSYRRQLWDIPLRSTYRDTLRQPILKNYKDLFYDAGLSAADRTCLNAHNRLRDLHKNTQQLVWDQSLADEAKSLAQYLLQRGVLEHAKGNNFGENIYHHMGLSTPKVVCANAVLKWYKEISNYDFQTGSSSNSKPIGHFTQVVWKASTKVGVGIAKSTPDSSGYIYTFIVARYTPAGNFRSQYLENVGNRKAGAVTPTLAELDPSTIPPCENTKSEWECDFFKKSTKYGPCTNPKWSRLFENDCRKFCGFC